MNKMIHTTSFEEKRFKLDLKAIKRGIFIGFISLIGLFLFVGGNKAFAGAYLTEDFESATSSVIMDHFQTAVGEFTSPCGQSRFITDNTRPYESSWGMSHDIDKVGCDTLQYSGGNATTTQTTFWAYVDGVFSYEIFQFYLTPGTACAVQLDWLDTEFELDSWNKIVLKTTYEFGVLSCYLFVNSNLIESASTTMTHFDSLNILSSIPSGNTIYFDDFEYLEECDEDHCALCEHFGTCIDAGCSWYYSIYLQESWCIDYYEPGADECGSFFKCQFCTTTELCEAELNCEWKDIGFGERCYMIEPTVPPVQEEWQVPALEDCNEITPITAKFLCEIKNLLAGIFMPSQEKIDVLFQTIGAFKMKLPFNYVNEISVFLDAIRTSIDDEAEIPIKILGQESTVSFAFWNSTTSIGGQVETLKNVVIDFSSIIMIIAWLMWLLSLIRRFFR